MKHKTFIPILLFLCLLHLANPITAQTDNYPILSMEIVAVPIANDTLGGLPNLSDSTIFNTQMHVALFDTTNILQIDVVLSDVGSSGNRLQQTFDWDVSGSTGNGTSYSRSGYDLTLDLGNYAGLLRYSADVRIKRTDNTYTDLINFSR